MSHRLNIRLLLKSGGLWIGLLAIPLAANLMIWKLVLVPQQRKLSTWRNEEQLNRLKPKLAELLNESQQVLSDAQRARLDSDDPSAAMQVVQRLAERHRVQIKQLSAEGQGKAEREADGFSTVPINLQVTGRFSKLAHWISEVETQPGLHIDSWHLVPGKEADAPHELTVHLTAFLGGA